MSPSAEAPFTYRGCLAFPSADKCEPPHIETFFLRRFFQLEKGADNGLALAGLIYDFEYLGGAGDPHLVRSHLFRWSAQGRDAGRVRLACPAHCPAVVNADIGLLLVAQCARSRSPFRPDWRSGGRRPVRLRPE